MKKTFLVFLIFPLFLSFNLKLSAKNNLKKDSTTAISVAVVGDLMCHSVQFNYAETDSGFNFNPAYRFVSKYLANADFTFGNLETVTAGKSKGFSGYPLFNSPDEYISALKKSGFDLLTTANNHSLDRGEKGLLRTIDQIKKNDIDYNGTFISAEDRDSLRIYNINGINIAFLAYTYGTNGIPVPSQKNYLINIIDTVLIKNDILNAKTNGSDIIIVHFHFGNEYEREPDSFQKEIVKKTINYGADIIIGGHPHVLQPVKYFKTVKANPDSGFVAYSLGNFFSNQRWRYSDAGMILYISISQDIKKNSLFIKKIQYTPTWVFRGETEKGNEFVILPSQEVLENPDKYKFLSSYDLLKIKQSLNDTKEILTKYTSEIEIYDYEKELIDDIKKLLRTRPLEESGIIKNKRFNNFKIIN